MPIAQVILTDYAVLLRTPYDPGFVDDLKLSVDWQCRKWDGSSKVWEIDPLYKDLAIQICERHYGAVVIDDQTSPVPAAIAGSTDNWADVLFKALPEDLHKSVFRKLAMVLHPDQGGDTELIRTLTEAYARRQP